MIKVFLNEIQRKELEQFRRQASSKNSEKALMVLLSADGKTVANISATIKRNPHTVRDWLKRYKTQGLSGLSRKFSNGRPDNKRKIVKKRIKIVIANSPENYGYIDKVWTVPLIVHDISQNLKIAVSRDTVLRALKNLGYTYKRPSKAPSIQAPSREEKAIAIKKMIDEIKKLLKNEKCEIYALDESHFSTQPYLVQGWFFKRWPPQNIKSKKKRKSHFLWLLESKNKKILLEKVQ